MAEGERGLVTKFFQLLLPGLRPVENEKTASGAKVVSADIGGAIVAQDAARSRFQAQSQGLPQLRSLDRIEADDTRHDPKYDSGHTPPDGRRRVRVPNSTPNK